MACYSILQVEDDPNDIYFMEYASRRAQIHDSLQVVRSGEEAIDYFQGAGQYSDRVKFPIPCLVLLDLRMPRLSGLEVLRWIRSHRAFRAVVIIMFTSSAHPGDIEHACELGANAFVQKPVGPDELVRFLDAVKAFWLEFHQFPQSLSRAILERR